MSSAPRALGTARPARSAALVALAAAVLLGTACADEPSAPSATPASVPTTSAPAVAALPADRVGRTHRMALGLVALGALGAERGSTQALRSLADRTGTDGRALDAQVREVATAGGLALGDDVGPGTQRVLTDLRARRDGFDEAWLRAVTDLTGEGLSAAGDLRSTPGASPEAGSLARNVQSRLAALSNALRRATARAGAPTR